MFLIHSTLAWGLLLVAAPIVIHLLNLLRQRRVEWAAMQFLLASHRKRRHWVWLRQLLLLLSRMAVMALAVAMLARLVTRERWTAWFEPERTHYYLLVDDSYSMAERAGAATAFDRGVETLKRLVESARQQGGPDRLTLIRFSDAVGGPSTVNAPDRQTTEPQTADPKTAELQTVELQTADSPTLPGDVPPNKGSAPVQGVISLPDLSDPQAWRAAWESLQPTETSSGPEGALTVATQLVKNALQERSVVFVISDFRAAQWENATAVRHAVSQLTRAGASVEFVRCVDAHRPNLTVRNIRQLTPQAAAGVPVMLSVEIQNHGPDDVHQVPLRFAWRASSGSTLAEFPISSLPDQVIDAIPAGGVVPVRVQALFPAPGEQIFEARVPQDAIETDDRYWQVVSVADHLPILVIAEQDAEQDAFFLQSVFQPDSTSTTGYRAVVQPVSFLRQLRAEDLQKFASVYVLDSPVLDEPTYAKLVTYVQQGGSLAIFAGPRSDTEFWNIARQSNRSDSGSRSGTPFDLTARRVDTLPSRDSADLPDLRPAHAMFQVLEGDRNPWLSAIQVERYLELEIPAASVDNTTAPWEIAASLRNGAPLAMTRPWGSGRLAAFATTLGPRWNNWARQPSFVVFILSLQEYLTRAETPNLARTVGEEWIVQLPATNYRRSFQLRTPGADPLQETVPVSGSMDEDPQRDLLRISLPRAGRDPASLTPPLRGPYRLDVVQSTGTAESRAFVVNVTPTEGDLRIVPTDDLKQQFAGLPVRIRSSGEAESFVTASDRSQWSQWLLWPLLAVFLVEQVLGYFTSYHPHAKVA